MRRTAMTETGRRGARLGIGIYACQVAQADDRAVGEPRPSARALVKRVADLVLGNERRG
jgi:hypothetical protein